MKNVVLSSVLALCTFALMITGCGSGKPKTVVITGSVTVAGETVETGMITFKPVDGQGMDCGGAIKEGRFEVECTPGEKKIQAYGSKVVGTFVPDPLYPDRTANKLEDIPAKVFTEEVTINVENKKKQDFTIEYTGEGAPKK